MKIREEGGAVALGRVLTLVIATPLGEEEEAIEAANDASREHPMRVIVLSHRLERDARRGARLDAQIRVGGDAGASEVIVLRAYGDTASDEEGLVTGLLLPDAPVVVWWPRHCPASPEHARRSAGSRSAGSRMPPRARESGAGARDASAPTTPPATPTSPGPGSPCGAPSSPRCSTSRRTSRSPGSR